MYFFSTKQYVGYVVVYTSNNYNINYILQNCLKIIIMRKDINVKLKLSVLCVDMKFFPLHPDLMNLGQNPTLNI